MGKVISVRPRRESNLYRFIRLMLGESITDTAIAKKWKIDVKNFSDFKFARYPMIRINRLVALARILKVDDHLIYEVAKGKPAERMHRMIVTPSGRKKLGKTIASRYTEYKLAESGK